VSPPTHPIEIFPSLRSISGLPQHLTIQDHVGVAGNYELVFNCSCLTPGVLNDQLLGDSCRQLLDTRNDDVELDT
jgi:hypothetical protein